MAKRKAPNRVVWPDERFKSETVPGKAGVVYAERSFDPIWGFERWGYEIHVRRGPQRFTRTDENGDPVKVKGPDGQPVVREVLCEGGENYGHETDLHDVVVLTGRGLQHIEENDPDWKLPAGLTASPPFSERGQAMFREAGLASRYSDAFEPLPGVIRATLLDECGIACERLPYLSGEEIEAVISTHRKTLGLDGRSERPLPLSKAAALIYEKLLTLKPHEAMLTRQIQDWYEEETGRNLDEGTWKKLHKEMEPYGLKNRRRAGYYIDQKMTL